MNYLQNFGYLPQSDRETGNLRSEAQLIDAIKNMQAFANVPVTGALDNETQSLLRKRRCGLPDVPSSTAGRRKRYTVHGQKWHTTNLTWSLQTRSPRSLDYGRVRRELHNALDVWAQNSRLTFEEVDRPDADILVYFQTGYHGDGYPFDGRGLILAHAFFPGTGRGGDAHFDEDEVWQLEGDASDSGGTSLFAVAAHEFGHSLGLSHSSVSGALMYPWYQGWTEHFQLPNDDRIGIQQLYGAKEEKLWGKIPQYEPGSGGRGRNPSYRPPNTTPIYYPQNPRRPTPRVTTAATTTTKTTTPHPRGDKPDTCDTSYDAISVIRSEIFIFKGKFMWRISDKGLLAGYPVHTHRLWASLPRNLTRIDAVYERLDKKIVFFIGRKYYLLNGTSLENNYPKDLTALGLPPSLDHIDGAMVWGHNSKTYFFSGTMYWRYDEEAQHVELDYPRDMSIWKGVGYYIDDVFQWKDGATYFFKGKGFWKFNDLVMRVENERQTLSAQFWMKCPHIVDDDDNYDRDQISKDKYYGKKNKYFVSRNDRYRNTYNVNTNDYEVTDDNDVNSNSNGDDNKSSSSKINGSSVAIFILPLLLFIYSDMSE